MVKMPPVSKFSLILAQSRVNECMVLLKDKACFKDKNRRPGHETDQVREIGKQRNGLRGRLLVQKAALKHLGLASTMPLYLEQLGVSLMPPVSSSLPAGVNGCSE